MNFIEEKLQKALASVNAKLAEQGQADFVPEVAAILLKAKVKLSNTDETLENGCIGKIFGCKVFVSNNIYCAPDGDIVSYKCVMRTKRAIAFAEQISDIYAYRPEKRFSDAVKGLHLYGVGIVYPDELLTLTYSIKYN